MERPASTTFAEHEDILDVVGGAPAIRARMVSLQVDIAHLTVRRMLPEQQLQP
jgi:hypothetical protein